MANIIDAVINLVLSPEHDLREYYNYRNRANSAGESLEEYVKDLFAGTLGFPEGQARLEKIEKIFSYLGNDSNPPDALLRGGDAIEVKKVSKIFSEIQLNSSHPKSKLFSDSTMVTAACRTAEKEPWIEKDLLYIVGAVTNGSKRRYGLLRSLFMVYGIDYAATEETYLRVKRTVQEGIGEIPGIQFAPTKELGRVNRVDPLGITLLRVRGMWIIQNPWVVFNYLVEPLEDKEFNFCAIINREKYDSFENRYQIEDLAGTIPSLLITDGKIKNPDNPAELKEAKIIRYSR